MKKLFFILFINLFTSASFAHQPPRLQSSVAILLTPTIQFLPNYLRQTTLFQERPAAPNAQPLAAFFNLQLRSSARQYQAWSYEELAFFCKIEVQMEKAAKMPIKFRIGEVQYVERLEGKYE